MERLSLLRDRERDGEREEGKMREAMEGRRGEGRGGGRWP